MIRMCVHCGNKYGCKSPDGKVVKLCEKCHTPNECDYRGGSTDGICILCFSDYSNEKKRKKPSE